MAAQSTFPNCKSTVCFYRCIVNKKDSCKSRNTACIWFQNTGFLIHNARIFTSFSSFHWHYSSRREQSVCFSALPFSTSILSFLLLFNGALGHDRCSYICVLSNDLLTCRWRRNRSRIECSWKLIIVLDSGDFFYGITAYICRVALIFVQALSSRRILLVWGHCRKIAAFLCLASADSPS